jgi:hypothetical protein
MSESTANEPEKKMCVARGIFIVNTIVAVICFTFALYFATIPNLRYYSEVWFLIGLVSVVIGAVAIWSE